MHPILIGKQAPLFTAKAVVKGNIIDPFSLSNFLGQYILFFFYPLDFTFVCPTELHAFQEKLSSFKERNAEVVGCSVDSAFSHLAWLNTPKYKGGIQGVEYPLVADLTKTISRQYQVLKEEEGFSAADYRRGIRLLEKKELFYNLSAVCVPGVGDAELIHEISSICHLHRSILITAEKDLYDFLTHG